MISLDDVGGRLDGGGDVGNTFNGRMISLDDVGDTLEVVGIRWITGEYVGIRGITLYNTK